MECLGTYHGEGFTRVYVIWALVTVQPYTVAYRTNGGIDKTGRERYRTGFPAAGDIIHRERHTEPTGMVYSRFFSAENCGQNV